MQDDAATVMKTRLRADLLAAMKAKRMADVPVLRALIAAVDNAEAPPAREGQPGVLNDDFLSGSAEVRRMVLSQDDVRAVIDADAREREQAAAQFDSLGKSDMAETLRAGAELARRYLSD